MVVVTSLGPPDEGVMHTETETTAYINEKCIGQGTLYISEARVSWVGGGSPAGDGHKFSLEYPHVALHAVSRDVASFPHVENLYLMIDAKLIDSDGSGGSVTPISTDHDDESSGSSENDGGEADTMTEIRFAPRNKDRLQDMFKAMSACQALHPDPGDENDDGEDENGEDDEEDEDEDGGMFDDAEEGDDEAGGPEGPHSNGEQQQQQQPMDE